MIFGSYIIEWMFPLRSLSFGGISWIFLFFLVQEKGDLFCDYLVFLGRFLVAVCLSFIPLVLRVVFAGCRGQFAVTWQIRCGYLNDICLHHLELKVVAAQRHRSSAICADNEWTIETTSLRTSLSFFEFRGRCWMKVRHCLEIQLF